jgi:hypothetical protein
MELVIAVALAFVIAWLIGAIGATSIDRAVSALAQFFGGLRPDPWPRGVQEEDRDQPWGTPVRVPRGVSQPAPAPKPQLVDVRAVVRRH